MNRAVQLGRAIGRVVIYIARRAPTRLQMLMTSRSRQQDDEGHLRPFGYVETQLSPNMRVLKRVLDLAGPRSFRILSVGRVRIASRTARSGNWVPTVIVAQRDAENYDRVILMCAGWRKTIPLSSLHDDPFRRLSSNNARHSQSQKSPLQYLRFAALLTAQEMMMTRRYANLAGRKRKERILKKKKRGGGEEERRKRMSTMLASVVMMREESESYNYNNNENNNNDNNNNLQMMEEDGGGGGGGMRNRQGEEGNSTLWIRKMQNWDGMDLMSALGSDPFISRLVISHLSTSFQSTVILPLILLQWAPSMNVKTLLLERAWNEMEKVLAEITGKEAKGIDLLSPVFAMMIVRASPPNLEEELLFMQEQLDLLGNVESAMSERACIVTHAVYALSVLHQVYAEGVVKKAVLSWWRRNQEQRQMMVF